MYYLNMYSFDSCYLRSCRAVIPSWQQPYRLSLQSLTLLSMANMPKICSNKLTMSSQLLWARLKRPYTYWLGQNIYPRYLEVKFSNVHRTILTHSLENLHHLSELLPIRNWCSFKWPVYMAINVLRSRLPSVRASFDPHGSKRAWLFLSHHAQSSPESFHSANLPWTQRSFNQALRDPT